MARPTIEKKDAVLRVRISQEQMEKLLRQGENVSETVRGMIDGKETRGMSDGEFILQGTISRCPIEASEFYYQISELIESGEIWIENGEVRLQPVQMGMFKDYIDACEEKGLDVMEKLKKDTQMIRSMRVGGAGGA